MDQTQGSTPQYTEKMVLDAVAVMRKNPAKYKELRQSLRGAKSDEDRVKQLLTFATSDREIATLIPSGGIQTEAAAITTVTVTTVFILADSAY
jgi:hypothetical protein